MTEATSEGQVTTGPSDAGPEHTTWREAGPRVDPLNAAISATAGGLDQGLTIHPMNTLPTPEQNAAAMQAYIDEGVRHATGHFGSAEVVSVAAFREALGKLLEHLHLDHPENYLPKG